MIESLECRIFLASDLVVSSGPGVGAVTAGSTGTLAFTLKNQGAGGAASSTTRIQVKNANNTATLYDQDFAEAALASGGTRPASITLPAQAAAGTYNVYVILDRYGVAGQGGATGNDIYSTTWTVNPAPPGGGDGLAVTYWDNIAFTGPTVTRVDATVDNDWGAGSPSSSVGADTFSARWTGQVQPPTGGAYTFYATADDGVRLWVNGQLLVDNWVEQPPTTASGTITLAAGVKYDIRIDYYENAGGAVAKLEWAGPGVARQVVPRSQLFSGSSAWVSPPSSLSSGPTLAPELEYKAPQAASAGERVRLWLAQNRDVIKEVATSYGVSPIAIAGVIAWEAIENPGISLRGSGIGKVHITKHVWELADALLRLGRGSGVARQIEDIFHDQNRGNRFITQRSIVGRDQAFRDDRTSLEYIAAIMDEYARRAEQHGIDIRNNPVVLANLFNGIESVELDDGADQYFSSKRSQTPPGETVVFRIVNAMALSVQHNLSFLQAAID